MKIKVSVIVLTLIIFCSCQNGNRSRLEDLDGSLKLAISIGMDDTYTDAFKAYTTLIEGEEDGYRVLSDTWAEGIIPEQNWRSWDYDYVTRYTMGESFVNVQNYNAFLDERLLNDDVYFSFATNALSKSEVYGPVLDSLCIEWIKYAEKDKIYFGHRKLGYSILKNRYPEVPYFDFMSNNEESKVQIEMIVEFLENAN